MTACPWFAATLLAIEAGDVVVLRWAKLATGGQEAMAEAELMVTEKVVALFETCGSLCAGATPAMVVAHYRRRVAANAARLGTAREID